MLVDPPVDKLLEKVDCKYELCTLLSKRARYLMEKRPDYLESTEMHPVTLAAKEVCDDTVYAEREE